MLIPLLGHLTQGSSWYKIDSAHISTAGDDAQTLIWDLFSSQPVQGGDPNTLEPMLSYKAEKQITGLLWPVSHPEWIGISFDNKMQLLKV